MSVLQAIVLGIVQGLTEFLPVSSSGHLVLGQALLGVQQPGIRFEILVHVATAFSIYFALYSDVNRLFMALLRLPRAIVQKTFWSDKDCKLVVLLILGSIPAGVFGVLFHDVVADMFASVTLVGGALIATGVILLGTSTLGQFGYDADNVTPMRAIIIGIGQALALIPGISRSGATIATGLWLGLERRAAARFSFLLALPAIIGAAIFDIAGEGMGARLPMGVAVAGFISALLAGYVAIRLLLRILTGGGLQRFAYYCLFAGVVALVWGILF